MLCQHHDMFPATELSSEGEYLRFLTPLRCVRNDRLWLRLAGKEHQIPTPVSPRRERGLII